MTRTKEEKSVAMLHSNELALRKIIGIMEESEFPGRLIIVSAPRRAGKTFVLDRVIATARARGIHVEEIGAEAVAESMPFRMSLLYIDDLHQKRSYLLDRVDEMVAQLPFQRWIVLVTVRDGDPLIGDLERRGGIHVKIDRPLPSDLKQLLKRAGPTSDEEIERILLASDHIPGHAIDLARFGSLRRIEEEVAAAISLSPGLRHVCAALAITSATDGVLDLDTFKKVRRTLPSSLSAARDLLTTHHLVIGNRFVDVPTVDVVSKVISYEERMQIHARTVEVLTANGLLDDDRKRRAAHHYRSLGDIGRANEYEFSLGNKLLANGRDKEAIVAFDRIDRRSMNVHFIGKLQMDYADAHLRLGNYVRSYDSRLEAMAEFERSGESDNYEKALNCLARYAPLTRDPTKVRYSENVVRSSIERYPFVRERAVHLSWLALHAVIRGDRKFASSLFDLGQKNYEYLSVEDRAEFELARAVASVMHADRLEEHDWQPFARARQLALDHGSFRAAAQIELIYAGFRIDACDHAVAKMSIGRAIRLAGKAGVSEIRYWSLSNLCYLAALEGDLVAADRLCAIERGENDTTFTFSAFASIIAFLDFVRRRANRTKRAELVDALDCSEVGGNNSAYFMSALALAYHVANSDNPQNCAEYANLVFSVAAEGAPGFGLALGLVPFVSNAVLRKFMVSCRSSRGHLEKSVHESYIGAVDAELARRDGRIAEASRLAQRAAKAAIIAGRLVPALLTYRQADSIVRARSIEQQIGLKHDDMPTRTVDSLSNRESMIATLAAQGMKNNAIAHALSISPYTVEKHMTSILAKCGVRSRHQISEYSEIAAVSSDYNTANRN